MLFAISYELASVTASVVSYSHYLIHVRELQEKISHDFTVDLVHTLIR